MNHVYVKPTSKKKWVDTRRHVVKERKLLHTTKRTVRVTEEEATLMSCGHWMVLKGETSRNKDGDWDCFDCFNAHHLTN